ncbi:2227_t:CDS:2, partial [Rhizophagus irregularis]
MPKFVHRKRSTRNTSKFQRKKALRSIIRSDKHYRWLFDEYFHEVDTVVMLSLVASCSPSKPVDKPLLFAHLATQRQDSFCQDGRSRANFINLYSFPLPNLGLRIDSSIHIGSSPPVGFSAYCGCRVLDDNTYQWCEECDRIYGNNYVSA